MNASPALHMLSFRPDMGRLMRLGARERLLPIGNDLGYTLHAVFAASFARLAPKPFVLLPPGAQDRAWRLLAYSSHALGELWEHAAAFADPDFLAPLAIDTAASKIMPCIFTPGTRFDFRLRVRPVVRTGKANPKGLGKLYGGEGRKAKEMDAYQAAVISTGRPDGLSRGTVYGSWLEAQLAHAGATLERVSLDKFCHTCLMTRDRSKDGKANRHAMGPDATMTGNLHIVNPTAFAAGLARGMGRHRAFGFGMLLLAPPR